MREITTEERRARLARRHRLSPGHRADAPEEAAESLVALHATDPATIYLSTRARLDGFEVADLDRALYSERTLVKHLAMRRTLFVLPRATLGAAQAGASERVAGQERRRLVKDVERADLQDDGERWLQRCFAAVGGALEGGRAASSSELRQDIPLLEGSILYGEGKSWGGEVAVGPRVLTVMCASGLILRGPNDGGWRTSRPLWVSASEWLGKSITSRSEEEGVAALVERYLAAFGPATEADIKWWLGSTLTLVRRALAEVGAVEVSLAEGAGYLLIDDLDPVEPVPRWAALLPSLDPTAMGWFERDWYLGPHRDAIFDRAGNAGHTAWVDGRIVGGWRQGPDGAVELQLLEDLDAEGVSLLEAEAAALANWLDGEVVSPRFPSPLAKRDR